MLFWETWKWKEELEQTQQKKRENEPVGPSLTGWGAVYGTEKAKMVQS